MKRILIHNAMIVNEGKTLQGSLVIENGYIAEVLTQGKPLSAPCDETIDATGCYLLPGVIDDHVHFREPGMTHKADIRSESRAAAAGGVTSVMDMPNNVPPTTTLDALSAKQELMERECRVNYACYYGATNDNYRDFSRLDRSQVCGIKLFMGSSTGNLLVDDLAALHRIFTSTDLLIAAHCEDQSVIARNLVKYRRIYAKRSDIPLNKHAGIRSTEACYASSSLAVSLARESGARLHLLHISTSKELQLLEDKPLAEKRITAEVCLPHLLFGQADYVTLGSRIKCNPAVKNAGNGRALRLALSTNLLDVVATDHAPHLLSEKEGGATQAASGMPMVQFSLVAMLGLVDEGVLSIETLVQKMCHAPADLFRIDRRGYVREGYHADIVLVRPHMPWTLDASMVLSKCGWSPLEGRTFDWRVEKTFVNGRLAYDGVQVDDNCRGESLHFNV